MPPLQPLQWALQREDEDEEGEGVELEGVVEGEGGSGLQQL